MFNEHGSDDPAQLSNGVFSTTPESEDPRYVRQTDESAQETADSSDIPLDFTRLRGCSLVVVAAHSDDEAIGLGVHLRSLPRIKALIHVTDGAPRNEQDARNAGFASWSEYAAERSRESANAMEVAGANCNRRSLGIPDQQTVYNIEQISNQLSAILRELRPDVVITHPYEGGHPDHDSTAACVHAACAILDGNSGRAPRIAEFASYHAGANALEVECFLGESSTDDFLLSESERDRKLQIFRCYESQAHVLQAFPCRREPVRWAPRYNFSLPPHAGKLNYEQFEWGVDGETWRKLATSALEHLVGRTCL
jgi:LmbE family N-acetylglucosaminyl deacetylase